MNYYSEKLLKGLNFDINIMKKRAHHHKSQPINQEKNTTLRHLKLVRLESTKYIYGLEDSRTHASMPIVHHALSINM